MLLTTADSFAEHDIEATLGLVRGSSIRTRHMITDIAEWLRNLVGAELHQYTKMLAECREQALDRLKDHARQVGADGVIAIHMESSSIAGGAAEILVYGTAVRFRRRG